MPRGVDRPPHRLVRKARSVNKNLVKYCEYFKYEYYFGFAGKWPFFIFAATFPKKRESRDFRGWSATCCSNTMVTFRKKRAIMWLWLQL